MKINIKLLRIFSHLKEIKLTCNLKNKYRKNDNFKLNTTKNNIIKTEMDIIKEDFGNNNKLPGNIKFHDSTTNTTNFTVN